MLLGLVRHRVRQQFVADIVRFRLSADLGLLAAAGAMGHPKGPQQGIVPGEPEWEYCFHGCGCCLTHRGAGEEIDVDFFDATADWFDRFFYLSYLKSLQSASYVEQRVISLHPSLETAALAIDGLLRAGLLEKPGNRGFRLTFDHEELAAVLDRVGDLWHESDTRFMVASAVGDWLLLEGMPCRDSARSIVSSRAKAASEDRSRRLVRLFRSGVRQAEAIEALSELKSPALDQVLTAALRGPCSGATSAALEVVERAGDARWCDDVEALVSRVDPNTDLPSPFIWLKCCEFLLRNGRGTGIEARLLGVRSQALGDAAILALEHFPSSAIELFRRALRSTIPCNRITAAAALAVIDRPWCRREPAAVLTESNDQTMTSECRSALFETHSTECHELVRDWETRNSHEPESREWISLGEMSLRMTDETIRWEMRILHERVLPLRNADGVA